MSFLNDSDFAGGGEHSHDSLDLGWPGLPRSYTSLLLRSGGVRLNNEWFGDNCVFLLYSLKEVDGDTTKWAATVVEQ